MDDQQIHRIIEQLVAEEQELWQRESAGDSGDAERQRLGEVTVHSISAGICSARDGPLREAKPRPRGLFSQTARGRRALPAVGPRSGRHRLTPDPRCRKARVLTFASSARRPSARQ